jgi:hypothetical protein
MTEKEIKHYRVLGFQDDLLLKVVNFLEENKYELFNLAMLGANEYRVMYRRTDNKVDAQIFSC